MKIPLFPLHTVLCPGIVVPLHIFEERYREMTRRCLDTGEPFGVVLIREGREVGSRSISTLAGVGAFAEIRRAGRYPDGRYDLLAAGTGRFMIESVDAGSAAYLVADVTPLDDEVGDEPRAERLAATAIGRFVRYLELMRARDGETADVLDIQVENNSPDFVNTVGDTPPINTQRATTKRMFQYSNASRLCGTPSRVIATRESCDRKRKSQATPAACRTRLPLPRER